MAQMMLSPITHALSSQKSGFTKGASQLLLETHILSDPIVQLFRYSFIIAPPPIPSFLIISDAFSKSTKTP